MNQEENELERALRLAAREPAHRPDFYRILLASTVYALGPPGQPQGQSVVAAGQKISLQTWSRQDGSAVLPFFSSLAALQRGITVECKYLAMTGRELFELTRGASLVLNPNSPQGKEFFPAEIEALLAGGVNRVAEQRVTGEATRVLLGQPAEVPTRLVESLRTFLTLRESASRGYLFLMHDPSHDAEPHLVVGIEGDGDLEALMREAGAVAADASPEGRAVDLIRVVRGQPGLSEYCEKEVTPFYARRPGFAPTQGPGRA